MKVAYKYFWNKREDEHGRNLGMWDGFTPGDPLCLAYEGEIDIPVALDPLELCEMLFAKFNMNEARPEDYRGPSMSVGSVIQLFAGAEQVSYSVASVGFKPVDFIVGSPIVPTDPRWIGPRKEITRG